MVAVIVVAGLLFVIVRQRRLKPTAAEAIPIQVGPQFKSSSTSNPAFESSEQHQAANDGYEVPVAVGDYGFGNMNGAGDSMIAETEMRTEFLSIFR